MPGPFVPLVIGAQILMVASSGPPTVDVRATCQVSINATLGLTGGSYKETLDACVQQQNNALEQVRKNWASYPAAAKAHCIQAGVYMPSYVEWLTCLEMEVDVRRMRTEGAKAAQAEAAQAEAAQTKAAPPRRRSAGSRSGSESKRCPIVQFQAEGSIASVINC